MDLKLQLTTPCSLLAVRKVAVLMRTALASLVDGEDARAVELALVEALNNLVEHGNPDDEHVKLVVTFELEGEKLRMILRDEGKPFDIRRVRQRDLDQSEVAKLPTGGRGLPLIHEIMDQVDYSTRDGVNVTTFLKRVTRLPAPSESGGGESKNQAQLEPEAPGEMRPSSNPAGSKR